MATAAACHFSLMPRRSAQWWSHTSLLPSPSPKSFRHLESRRSKQLGLQWKAMANVPPIQKINLVDEDDDEACELVNGTELLIGEHEDSIRASLFKAVKNNNGAGLLLLSDIFGFEDPSTRDFAYRIACNGYNVLVPDLFHGNPWKDGQPTDEFEHWLARQQPERVANDIELSAKWFIDEFDAAGVSKKLGLVGFCFGGGCLIETLAKDQNSYFATGVCFYGTRINTSFAQNINVPVLFICGDNDPLSPTGVMLEMEKNMKGSSTVIYSGRHHGFAHRPESEEEDRDAEDSFSVMRNWLHECLLLNLDTADELSSVE
ncbi:hypothetical protein AXF42_Ash016310 [Apostasia shenzhenica]|uniref:Carboxymethylenebutenolidase homolog n=1 Tax=Apostasia shenzhenica TaxID=1088818 RepID=A0A2H9ZXG4_9ASPA|nr:hypothetical protein AXF42_Ash016310 [Apostasia shenzhenica]